MNINVNDIIVTKKEHPCKNNEFLVLRVGMDFKIRCTKCGREVMVPRAVFNYACGIFKIWHYHL